VRLNVSRLAAVGLALIMAFFLLGSSAPGARQQRNAALRMAVSGYTFDLLGWEVGALGEKAGAIFSRPANGIAPDMAADEVRAYMERAHRMGALEWEIDGILSQNQGEITEESGRLQREIDGLRAEQEANRLKVETIIQQQTSAELTAAGLGIAGNVFPPVQFAFTEPPKKMVVSPRDRIETVYAQMLAAEIDAEAATEAEATIFADENLSAYITRIGGLGAYPTMVVDRSSLPWMLNTVAHEWVHNYLTFFPLGIRYGVNPDITTLNETVADIVGNEIGARVVQGHYPEFIPEEETKSESGSKSVTDSAMAAEAPPVFDFNTEMRATRLEVDRLLAAGEVEEAEAYMEARRQEFVENGYALRALNQAYFAFHGSYGTSAASTDPIGPKLQQLRERSPDIPSFLKTVRSFTSAEDLDAALLDDKVTR